MSRVMLADAIRDVTGCTNAQANEAVGAVTEVIAKALKKEGKHQALADILESIEELKYYRKSVMTI